MKHRDDRKLEELKKRGLFSDDLAGVVVERACSLEQLRGAYRLVHDIYVEAGYIVPHPSGMRVRLYEGRVDTATFIARAGDEIVGVISVILDSIEMGLPSEVAFKAEIDALRLRPDRRLAEATNQVVAEAYRGTSVSTELMRCAVAHLVKAGVTDAISTVSASHVGFYELLGFDLLGSERNYGSGVTDPVVSMILSHEHYRYRPVSTDAGRFIRHFMTVGNYYLDHVEAWAKSAATIFQEPIRRWITDDNFLRNVA